MSTRGNIFKSGGQKRRDSVLECGGPPPLWARWKAAEDCRTPKPGGGLAASQFRASRGFSLVEILVTVTLLAFIILGLVAMFNQTRRAFMSSITQVDVLESGRSAADYITREMEQIMPVNSANLNVVNFYVDSPVPAGDYLAQPLIDPTEIRTNNLQRVCFVTRYNQQWNFIGYELLPQAVGNPSPAQSGIGTLYRYNIPNISLANMTALALAFNNGQNGFLLGSLPTTNYSRLIDGVVDFRIRAYDTNGNLFVPGVNLSTSGFNNAGTIFAKLNPQTLDQTNTYFQIGAVPAYVEIELGVLEDRALARYQSLVANSGGAPDGGPAAKAYLANHPGQVHIFRQRITIRNVNPAAY